MFRALRTDVEALFMTGPTVDLGTVTAELQSMQLHVANEVREPLNAPIELLREHSQGTQSY